MVSFKVNSYTKQYEYSINKENVINCIKMLEVESKH